MAGAAWTEPDDGTPEEVHASLLLGTLVALLLLAAHAHGVL